MSKEVPDAWKEVIACAERIGKTPAYIEQVKALAGTNENTLHRLCMQDRPALLPGVVQTSTYTMGFFSENPHGDAPDIEQAALRRDIWTAFIESGGHLEINIHPDALTRRPGNIGKTAMLDTLQYAHDMAQHDNIDLRVRNLDTKLAEQAATWRVEYPKGRHAGVVRAAVTVPGIPSILPIAREEEADLWIGEPGISVMENAWDVVHGNAHDADASLGMIREAIKQLSE